MKWKITRQTNGDTKIEFISGGKAVQAAATFTPDELKRFAEELTEPQQDDYK